MLGTLEQLSANYIAGYVTKKMSMYDDPRLLRADGSRLHPEFARMSLRPGIGATAMDEVASELMRFNFDTSQADVPSALRHGKKELPLGRYLRQQLRMKIGKDKNTPKEVQLQRSSEMSAMFPREKDDFTSLKSKVLEKFQGKRNSFKAKQQIYKKVRKI